MTGHHVRHYVLTRAVYDPAHWTGSAAGARLEVFEASTVASVAAQTIPADVWIIAQHADDPLATIRQDIVTGALKGTGTTLTTLTTSDHAGTRAQAADDAYRLPWTATIITLEGADNGGGRRLTTRLDDDDAFTPDAFGRLQHAARTVHDRRALIFPIGYRLHAGRITRVRHESNAMSTLHTPPGDTANVYDYAHRRIAQSVPVTLLDDNPAWLWVRHDNTLSGWKAARDLVGPKLRALFPVDWDTLGVTPTGDPIGGGERFR